MSVVKFEHHIMLEKIINEEQLLNNLKQYFIANLNSYNGMLVNNAYKHCAN
jgi:hypothetical protein